MSAKFLGVSWRFPVGLNEGDRIAMTEYEDSVRQAIWTILGTSKGERVMRPDFGCGIHDLVFAPNSAGTAGRLASEVRRALRQWEPRIDIEQVTAFPDSREPNKLLIEIHYKVRTTNNRFNLVYPFYLE
ncbi:baseplate protein [Leptolyngbya valderiana BDU 20041]|nr:baseplate protein [Leptolyngbya valderiana BDU 20041]